MANIDLSRIAGNMGALNALNSLNYINKQLGVHQTRLATGKRINQAADDAAGFVVATTFDVRKRGMQTALRSIGDAKNLMSTMEGGLRKIKDILVKMRNKALEAQTDNMGEAEYQAVESQVKEFRDEINDIVGATKWNDKYLLAPQTTGGSGTTDSLTFLADADGGDTSFSFEAAGNVKANQGFYATSGSAASADGLGLNDSALTITSASTASTARGSIDDALNIVKESLGQVGSYTARLSFKEEALTQAFSNVEGAYNRIMNADMAQEQVDFAKFQILQQTSTAMLAQANVAPQFILSLFQ
jgi:flagellin